MWTHEPQGPPMDVDLGCLWEHQNPPPPRPPTHSPPPPSSPPLPPRQHTHTHTHYACIYIYIYIFLSFYLFIYLCICLCIYIFIYYIVIYSLSMHKPYHSSPRRRCTPISCESKSPRPGIMSSSQHTAGPRRTTRSV